MKEILEAESMRYTAKLKAVRLEEDFRYFQGVVNCLDDLIKILL